MAKKIAKVDNDAMNSLFGAEFSRMAGKKVAADWQDEKGAPKDPQAFKDHSEYLEILKSVLKDDSGQDMNPNDPIKD
jgi:hypothetical protein